MTNKLRQLYAELMENDNIFRFLISRVANASEGDVQFEFYLKELYDHIFKDYYVLMDDVMDMVAHYQVNDLVISESKQDAGIVAEGNSNVADEFTSSDIYVAHVVSDDGRPNVISETNFDNIVAVVQQYASYKIYKLSDFVSTLVMEK